MKNVSDKLSECQYVRDSNLICLNLRSSLNHCAILDKFGHF